MDFREKPHCFAAFLCLKLNVTDMRTLFSATRVTRVVAAGCWYAITSPAFRGGVAIGLRHHDDYSLSALGIQGTSGPRSGRWLCLSVGGRGTWSG